MRGRLGQTTSHPTFADGKANFSREGRRKPRGIWTYAPRAGLAALLLTACTPGVDPDQSRLCLTALPALEPGETGIAVERVAQEGSDRLRIAYQASPAAGPPVARFALCRFGPDPLGRGRSDLVGITTDRGEVAGATLYLLKRYYIDTPDGVAAAPGAGAMPDGAGGLR